MSKLILFAEPTKARQVLLTQVETLVGRSPECDIVISQDRVSRRHAVVIKDGALVTIKDLDSQNGVFVNGVKTAAHDLVNGDEIMIGECKIRFFATELDLSAGEALRLLTVPGSLIDLDKLRPTPARVRTV